MQHIWGDIIRHDSYPCVPILVQGAFAHARPHQNALASRRARQQHIDRTPIPDYIALFQVDSELTLRLMQQAGYWFLTGADVGLMVRTAVDSVQPHLCASEFLRDLLDSSFILLVR